MLFEISRYVNIKTRTNICRLCVILNAIQHAWKANDPQVHETDLPLQDLRRKMHFYTSPKLFMRLDGVHNSFSFNFPHGK